MSTQNSESDIHDLEVTVWVGKAGIDPVVDELSEQLGNSGLVKVKFLRSARGGTTAESLAADLADRTDAEIVDTRGHTAVFTR